MKPIITVLLLLSFSGMLPAQPVWPDSVLIVRQLINISSSALRRSESDKAISVAAEALKIAERNNDTEGIAYSNRYLAFAYGQITDKPNEIRYLLQSMNAFKRTFNTYEIAEATRLTGAYYLKLDHNRMWELVNEALRQFKEINHRTGIFECTSNLGQVYFEQGNFQRALTYFQIADRLADSLAFEEGKARNLGRMSYAYWQLGQFNRQLQTLTESMQIYGDTSGAEIQGQLLGDLAIAYRNLKDYPRSERAFSKSIRIADSMRAVQRQQQLLLELAELYREWAKPQQALQMLDSAYHLYTRIYNKDLIDRLAEAETRFEINRREHENEMLRQKSEQSNLLWLLSTLTLAIVAVSFILRVASLKKHKADLEKQNRIILEQSDDLKKALVDLTKNEVQFRALFENSPVGILVINKDGVIRDANDRFCRDTGFRKHELIGSSVFRFAREEIKPDIRKNIEKMMVGENLRHETQRINKDGTVTDVELNEVKIEFPDGAPYFLVMYQDIAHRKRTESANTKRLREITAGSLSKTAYLTGLLDKLRPYTDRNISALKRLNGLEIPLADQNEIGNLIDDSEVIQLNLETAKTFFTSGLTFHEPVLGTILIRDFMNSVINEIISDGNSTDLQSHFSDQVPDQVLVDEKYFRFVLKELLNYCITGREDSRVQLTTGWESGADSDALIIHIESTGSLFPVGTLEWILNPDQTTIPEFPNNQLFLRGKLMMTGEVVRYLSGSIAVTEEPDGLFRFRLQIPV